MENEWNIFVKVLGCPYSDHHHLTSQAFATKYKQELEDFTTFSKAFETHNRVVASATTPFVDRLAQYFGMNKSIAEGYVEYYR